MKKAWVLSYPLSAQRKLCSDWAEAQTDLSLRWAHMPFCWFCHEVAQICLSLLFLLFEFRIVSLPVCLLIRLNVFDGINSMKVTSSN